MPIAEKSAQDDARLQKDQKTRIIVENGFVAHLLSGEDPSLPFFLES